MSNTKSELRAQGFAVTDAGRIECHREPHARWNHTHVAVIRLNVGDSKAAKDFCGKVIAAIDEPGALVGFGRTGAVMLFSRIGTLFVEVDTNPGQHSHPTAVHPFIFEGEEVSFIATSDGQTLEVSEFQWRDNRSPLTVARANLPPLFSDISKRAYDAVERLLSAHAGRWGKLPTAEEIAADAARERRYAKYREEIARKAAMTPEERAEAELAEEDDKLVAAHEGAEYATYDGIIPSLVLAARRRVARRKADAEAARVVALTPAEIQAREDAATVERFKDLGHKLTENDGELATRIIQARKRHASRQATTAAAR